MDDRELLEWAAKAIDLTLRYNYLGGRDANQPWNPLEDDGDALRLSVMCGIGLEFEKDRQGKPLLVRAFLPSLPDEVRERCSERYTEHDGNVYAATRMAITRAAAAIGEQKGKVL